MTSDTSLLRQAFVLTLVVLGTTAALIGAWHAKEVVLLTFAGWLLSLAFGRAAEFVERHTPLSRAAGLAGVLLLVVVPLVLLLGGFLADVGAEVVAVGRRLPSALQQLRARLAQAGIPLELQLEQAQMRRATGLLSSGIGAIGAVLYVLFLAVFFAAEPGVYRRALLALCRPEHRAEAARVADQVAAAMQRWMVARLLLMLIVAVLTSIGLTLLKVPTPLGLGALAGLLDFIPNIGPVLAAVPAVLLALEGDGTRLVWVVALYLGVQTVEAYILGPLFERRAVRMAPGLILAAQALLGFLAGWLGLMFATPLTAAALVVFRESSGAEEEEPAAKKKRRSPKAAAVDNS